MSITCGQCAIYQPSQHEPFKGAGMCGAIVEWLQSHKAKGIKPKPGALEMVYKSIGAKFGTASAICWPNADRYGCTKFVRAAA